MRRNFTRRGSIPVLALLAVLAAASAGYAATPAAADSVPSASNPAGDHRPSTWAYESTNAAALEAEIPTLTNDVGTPESDPNSQLLLGLGLLTVGLGALVLASAARVRTPRPPRGRSDAFVAHSSV